MLSSITLATAILATSVTACQRDWEALNRRIDSHEGHSHTKRDVVAFPPVLSKVESILVNSFDNKSLNEWSHYYTHGDHLGGHNKTMADWTAEKFRSAGMTASLAEFWIWATSPIQSSIRLTRPDGSVHNVSLIEDVLPEDETTSYPNLIPAYHAMSASGNVSAEYIYVGRGTRADYNAVKNKGIDLKGKIALVMYGGIYRGTKVKNAQDNGMAGAILFTDPIDDGDITVANGYEPYPKGPARNPSSIQRGSVRFASLYSGDPSTVGYASEKDGPRNSIVPYNPSIPSIPISMKDALPLLLALDGHGVTAKEANRSGWVGGLNASYSSGPSPGAKLDMVHVMENAVKPVWDVIGIINGTHPDEVLVVGNHRDAWVIGGAADPNSGSAILIEMSKAFGKLLAKGWKPRRTIIFGSWDAEEWGLQGSTEWVESHLPWLTSTAVAYVNIDVGVSGPRTGLSGTGEMHTMAIEQMKKVIFPQGWGIGPTLYDMWYNTTKGEISPLGSGSDYASFYHAGISAIDIGSDAGRKDPVYHYHSNYDSYHWMSTFADPGFLIHAAMGQWLSLITYHIADDPLIPWDLPNAARVLKTHLSDLNETISPKYANVSLSPIRDAIAQFEARAAAIDAAGKTALALNDSVMLGVVNSKYRDFSRGFVSVGGLPGRESFRNVVSAPGIDNGYGADVFPAVQDSLLDGNLTKAAEWVGKTASAVLRAAEILKI